MRNLNGIIGLLGLMGLALHPACSSEETNSGGGAGGQSTTEPPEPTAELRVTAKFPSADALQNAGSLHVWALMHRGEAQTTCAALKAGAIDPYDLSLRQVADTVSTKVGEEVVAPKVVTGDVLVYVEAVDYIGRVDLAGCVSATIAEPSTSAVVPLSKAGVYDCSDPDSPDGAPCDDGKLCTIGETCQGGACQGARTRDCSNLSDACNAGLCDPIEGCIFSPVPDGSPCNDGLFCTVGDACIAGSCQGSQRDCGQGLGPCEISNGCDESLARCDIVLRTPGASCDDGSLCTTLDQCDFSGNCAGTPRDCSILTSGCQVGSCDMGTGNCVANPAPFGTTCDDGQICTNNDICNAGGTCTGSPLTGTTCDDGNFATTVDLCQNGICVGTP